jgi:hypothetical protein
MHLNVNENRFKQEQEVKASQAPFFGRQGPEVQILSLRPFYKAQKIPN